MSDQAKEQVGTHQGCEAGHDCVFKPWGSVPKPGPPFFFSLFPCLGDLCPRRQNTLCGWTPTPPWRFPPFVKWQMAQGLAQREL